MTKRENIRLEVMNFIDKDVDAYMDKFLISPDKIWQPTDFYLIQVQKTF